MWAMILLVVVQDVGLYIVARSLWAAHEQIGRGGDGIS
jgi:hypothetical protein